MGEERRGNVESRSSRATRWRMWFESDYAWSGDSLNGAQDMVVKNRRADIQHTRAGHQGGVSVQEALGGGAFESQSCWAKWITSLETQRIEPPL